MSSFSERYGYRPYRMVAQIEGMDEPLRNGLWNCISTAFQELSDDSYFEESSLRKLGERLWFSFFKLPLDEMPNGWTSFRETIKKWVMTADWYRVYDFLEEIAAAVKSERNFIRLCDAIMARELAGYQFVNGLVSPVVDSREVNEIEASIQESSKPVSTHLSSALDLLSNRESPNFRKSISESILAVEAAARELSGLPNATLHDALKSIKVDIHPALKDAFVRLYGYSGDEGGIRHALKANGRESDLADARYMAVACSAFVNYLRAKSKKPLG